MCKDNNIPMLNLNDIIGNNINVENMTTPDNGVIGKVYTTDKDITYSIQDKSVFDVKEKINISDVVDYDKKKGDK